MPLIEIYRVHFVLYFVLNKENNALSNSLHHDLSIVYCSLARMCVQLLLFKSLQLYSLQDVHKCYQIQLIVEYVENINK